MPVAGIGDTATASVAVTTRTIERFAAVTGDDNPLHLDPEYAAEGLFGEPVAHGMLGGGVISAALARLPGDIIYLEQNLAFEAPVRTDETLTAEVEVVDEQDDGRLVVDTVARTDDPVITGEAVILSTRHPPDRS